MYEPGYMYYLFFICMTVGVYRGLTQKPTKTYIRDDKGFFPIFYDA